MLFTKQKKRIFVVLFYGCKARIMLCIIARSAMVAFCTAKCSNYAKHHEIFVFYKVKNTTPLIFYAIKSYTFAKQNVELVKWTQKTITCKNAFLLVKCSKKQFLNFHKIKYK